MNSNGASATSAWWRTVLGEYPTGVALVTSTDESGDPVSMIVGTFHAVSEDPPMIGFLPRVGSRTFGQIRANGTFSVSVLGSKHEMLSRALGSAREGGLDLAEWVRSRHGNLRVADALAWFDCTLEAVHPAGDHSVVLANVLDYGAGSGRGGLPLLFLRGGYGTFSVPSENFDVADLSTKLRMGDRLRQLMMELAHEHDTGVLLGAVTGDSVLVLAEEGPGQRDPDEREIGFSFPFAAPMSPVFAAWASEERVKQWLEGARHLIGAVDRPAFSRQLEEVRSRGYAVSAGRTMVDRFDEVIAGGGTRDELVSLWRDLQDDNDSGAEHSEDLSSIQIPVFDERGHAVMEVVLTTPPFGDPDRLSMLLDAAFDVARTSTQLIGGVVNADWDRAVLRRASIAGS